MEKQSMEPVTFQGTIDLAFMNKTKWHVLRPRDYIMRGVLYTLLLVVACVMLCMGSNSWLPIAYIVLVICYSARIVLYVNRVPKRRMAAFKETHQKDSSAAQYTFTDSSFSSDSDDGSHIEAKYTDLRKVVLYGEYMMIFTKAKMRYIIPADNVTLEQRDQIAALLGANVPPVKVSRRDKK